jgi:hypothetical protein
MHYEESSLLWTMNNKKLHEYDAQYAASARCLRFTFQRLIRALLNSSIFIQLGAVAGVGSCSTGNLARRFPGQPEAARMGQ